MVSASEWKIVYTGELDQTRHLSSETQDAFMSQDWAALEQALQAMNDEWNQPCFPPEDQPAMEAFLQWRTGFDREITEIDINKTGFIRSNGNT